MILRILVLVAVFALPGFAQSTMKGSAVVSGAARPGLVDNIQYDTYHGLVGVPCQGAATNNFRTEKIGTRWVLCTPNDEADGNNVFWSIAMYATMWEDDVDDLGNSHKLRLVDKYGDWGATWCGQQTLRLSKWYFNTVDIYAYSRCYPVVTDPLFPPPDNTNPYPLPYVGIIQTTKRSFRNEGSLADWPAKDIYEAMNFTYYTGFKGSVADFWDAEWEDYMIAGLGQMTIVDTSWLIGVNIGEGDNWYGFGAGDPLVYETDPAGFGNPHLAWLVLATSPLQAASDKYRFDNGAGDEVVYTNTAVFAKDALKTFMEGRYAAIGDLNTAWGSSYTTFGTAGTTYVDEACDTGDGSTTVFNCTLTNTPVTKFSMQMKRVTALEAGDAGDGGIEGIALNGSTINYSSGAVMLDFKTAPGNGEAITITYVSGGWGSGSGLMDEDGRNVSWMGATASKPWLSLTGLTASMKTDLNRFLYEIGKQALCTVGDTALAGIDPDALYLGVSVLGSWRAPARPELYEAAGECVDIITFSSDATVAFIDAVEATAGDVPVWIWVGYLSNIDSGLYAYPNTPTVLVYDSQPERGAGYASDILAYFQLTDSTNTQRVLGIKHWQYTDNWGEKANWGVISFMDNAYDGYQAANWGCVPGDSTLCTPCLDPDGIEDDPVGQGNGTVVNCGAEAAGKTYGNYLGFVKAANRDVLLRLLAGQ